VAACGPGRLRVQSRQGKAHFANVAPGGASGKCANLRYCTYWSVYIILYTLECIYINMNQMNEMEFKVRV